MAVVLRLSYTRGGDPATADTAKQVKEIRPCFGFVRRASRDYLNAPIQRSEQDKVRYGTSSGIFSRKIITRTYIS